MANHLNECSISSFLKSERKGKYLLIHIFITVSSCYRVFSYPCLEVYLDKNEVSIYRNSLINMLLKYKELQFTTSINNSMLLLKVVKCQHPYWTLKWVSVNDVLVTLSVADACWWEAWRILDWFQHWQPRNLILFFSGRGSSSGTAGMLKQKIDQCNMYIFISTWMLECNIVFSLSWRMISGKHYVSLWMTSKATVSQVIKGPNPLYNYSLTPLAGEKKGLS